MYNCWHNNPNIDKTNNYKEDLGEDFVNQLAYKSLLKYWCYPNVKDIGGDKKEIGDLLVLIKDICIIFTVKNYKFKDNHERYFQKENVSLLSSDFPSENPETQTRTFHPQIRWQ